MLAPGDVVTPQEIISAILIEFEQSVLPSYFKNYAKNKFRVYLYREDYEKLQHLFEKMRAEAVDALQERMNALNRRPGSGGVLSFGKKNNSKRYESTGSWTIEFLQNEDDDAGSERLIVESWDAIAPDTSTLQGERTVRVGKPVPEEATKRTSYSGQEYPPADSPAYATLNFRDDRPEPQSFPVTKDLIKVGRGGPNVWIDLKLTTSEDVSREHFQLRRDPRSGKFFIKDLSKFGTTVNGKTVPASVEKRTGQIVDKNIEIELPNSARIGLADILFMQFKILKQK
jgi:hypothetical protein